MIERFPHLCDCSANAFCLSKLITIIQFTDLNCFCTLFDMSMFIQFIELHWSRQNLTPQFILPCHQPCHFRCIQPINRRHVQHRLWLPMDNHHQSRKFSILHRLRVHFGPIIQVPTGFRVPPRRLHPQAVPEMLACHKPCHKPGCPSPCSNPSLSPAVPQKSASCATKA